MLITTGSAPQTRGIADALNQAAKESGELKGRIEGSFRSPWLLMDFGSVVVHVLTAEARDFYGLDRLWADAPELALPADDGDSARSAV